VEAYLGPRGRRVDDAKASTKASQLAER